VPVFDAGGDLPTNVTQRDLRGRLCGRDRGSALVHAKGARVDLRGVKSGAKKLYDMNANPYQLQSLHAGPDKARLIDELSLRLSDMKVCSSDSCRTCEQGRP
jgi:hypothetical protein